MAGAAEAVVPHTRGQVILSLHSPAHLTVQDTWLNPFHLHTTVHLPCSLSVCNIQVSSRPLRAQAGWVRGCHTAQECRSRHLSLFCRLVEPEGGHWVWAVLPWEPGAGITAAPPNQNRSRAELCRNWQGVAGFVLGRGGVHDWAWKEPTVRMRRWVRAWTRRAFIHQKPACF